MLSIRDYQIFQRENGCARVLFSGDIPKEFSTCARLIARVLREDDGYIVLDDVECKREESRFSAELILPEGGLYRIEAIAEDIPIPEGTHTVCIARVHHIGVGELFMLAGQSNMAGYGRGAIYDPPELGVHLYANDGNWKIAAHPLNDACNSIYPENREYNSFQSPALAFARTVRRILNVPIGLVQASLGGTPLRSWHPEEDGYLCRAMMRRLDAVGKVGAMLWYQGCSDAYAQDAPNYFERFSRAVQLWRETLGEIPIITVQLNRVAYRGNEAEDRYWGMIREAQRRAAKEIPNVYIVPAIDLPLSDGIHNTASANVNLGERMANVYLRGTVVPDILHARRVDETHLFLELNGSFRFDLINSCCPPLGFDIEDARGIEPCIRVEEKDGGLLLTAGRAFDAEAKLHAFWRQLPEANPILVRGGMPMLAAYGVAIEEMAQ